MVEFLKTILAWIFFFIELSIAIPTIAFFFLWPLVLGYAFNLCYIISGGILIVWLGLIFSLIATAKE